MAMPESKHILVVDDESQITRALRDVTFQSRL